MEANGHLSLVCFPWRISIIFGVETDTQQRFPKGIIKPTARFGNLCIQGSAPTTKSRTSASVSSWQNRASCFQDNVLKWPIKGFLDITSPCKAIFWWLNYKWIRNIWNEFPLGLAKHTSDLITSRIFERWFWVFVESNMASFSPVPFSLSGSLGRGQRLLKDFFFCLSLCS